MVGASVAMMGLTASAQTATISKNVQKPTVSTNKVNRTLGLNNFRNLPDAQLKQIGDRVSANGHPTRSTAAKLFSKSKSSRMAKASSTIVDSHLVSANYQASDTVFWEGFEFMDSEDRPYIPTNLNKWSTKSNIENLTPYIASGLCPTWTTYQGDGYYVPYAKEGDLMLVCMFGGEAYSSDGTTVIAPAPQQDEWLVSPTINGVSKDNYLSFDICYAPWDTHYFIEGTDSVFDRSRVAYDVDVLISTSTRTTSYNADDYTRVYRLSEMVDKEIAHVDMNDNEAVDNLLYMNWHRIQIPLAEYDGKNIRVAFRYTGTKGGSVLIDAVRVSDLLPVANYDIPRGSLYWGFSNEMYAMTNDQNLAKVALVPAYVPTVWNNLSNEDSKDFIWTYSVDGNSQQTKDTDLTMPGMKPSPMIEMPKLQSSSGLRSDEVTAGTFKVGGNTQMSYDNGQVVNYNVGNYDLTKSWWTAEIGQPGSAQYAFGTGSGSFWASNSNYRYNNVDGVANYFEKPQSPYVFNEVTLPLGDCLNLGAPLACTIYKVDADGIVTDEVLAQSIYNPADAKTKGSCTPIPGTAGMYCLKFVFDDAIVVNDAIFVSIDGFNNPNLIAIAPVAQALNHDNGIGYAFVKLNTQNNGYQFVEVAGALSSVDGGSNMNVSMCISMNAVFPYLNAEEGDIFAANSNGETKSFTIDSYWNPQKDWTISTSDSWIKAESVIDEVAQTVSLKITADALPSDKDGRFGTVKISALGCEQLITVLQGSEVTGIEGVANAKNFNDIDGTYTLAGQRINSSDAKNGIFLVKKNGKFVKVIK